jgi:hypothetical protein
VGTGHGNNASLLLLYEASFFFLSFFLKYLNVCFFYLLKNTCLICFLKLNHFIDLEGLGFSFFCFVLFCFSFPLWKIGNLIHMYACYWSNDHQGVEYLNFKFERVQTTWYTVLLVYAVVHLQGYRVFIYRA